jgi:hypothetical protein
MASRIGTLSPGIAKHYPRSISWTVRGANLVQLLQDRARSDECFFGCDGFSATHRGSGRFVHYQRRRVYPNQGLSNRWNGPAVDDKLTPSDGRCFV